MKNRGVLAAFAVMMLASCGGCGSQATGEQVRVSDPRQSGGVRIVLSGTSGFDSEFVMAWDRRGVKPLERKPSTSAKIPHKFGTADVASIDGFLESHLNRSNAAALQEVADAAHGTYVSEARKEMVSRIDGSVVRDFPVHSFAVDKAMKYAVYSFAAAGDNGPLIFDLGTFELTRLHGVPGTSLFNPIPKIDWNVAWSPDGRYLAYGTRLIEVYDPATKGSVRSWDIGRDVDSIAWSPSSTALAVLSHEGRLEKGPLSLLRALAGHPSRRYTISADVLWIDGSGQVETIVTDAFEGGEAEIEWVSDGEMTESLPPKAR